MSEVERPPRVRDAQPKGTRSVLSSSAFESFLGRERSLADRGTRRFSVLVLTRRPTAGSNPRGSDPLSELALRACRRLRSTDLVGRKDEDRVEFLLTDTEPSGAQVIATWVRDAEARLGLDLERTIYVYPSVEEPSSSNGRHTEPVEGRAEIESGQGGPTHPIANAAEANREPPAENRTSAGVGVLEAAAWPVKDLWPLLASPMPAWKRTFDILLSGLALLALFPLFVLVAIATRLDSPGPVIFRQWRAGRGGRPFVFYKFRSMTADAESKRAALAARNEQDGPVCKVRDDPRVTRTGRLLRRSSIDELPQLWNVIKGDISLVGPRSPMPDEVHRYARWERRRLSVTGGITCTWQVSGRSRIPFRDWMRLDMRYVSDRSVWLDLRLLAQTLPAVLSGRGAC
jgi:lipopolysaccharide/colanic/teichoic acid biosynthesis glycosyltransferase